MEGGCHCERNIGDVFLNACPSTSSLLNVKDGLIPQVSPFSYIFCLYYTNATITLYF